MIRLTLLTSLLLLTAGCANSGGPTPPPDWIAGSSAKHPTSHYLLGRGEAKRRSLAQDRARADLAKGLSVAIREQSRDTTHYQSEGIGEGQQRHLEQQSRRAIATETDQLLEGVSIGDLWQAPEQGPYHALAVLDRLQASARLRDTIVSLDQATGREIELARRPQGVLEQIGHAGRAVTLQQQRHRQQRLLRVVDPTGQGVSERYPLETLISDHDNLLERLAMRVVIDDDPLGGLESIVAGSVAEVGFSPATGGPDDHLLQVSLQAAPRQEGNWFWYRGSLQITLSRPDGAVLGSHRWPIKVSAGDSATAINRFRGEVEQRLDSELRSAVVGFADPLQEK